MVINSLPLFKSNIILLLLKLIKSIPNQTAVLAQFSRVFFSSIRVEHTNIMATDSLPPLTTNIVLLQFNYLLKFNHNKPAY